MVREACEELCHRFFIPSGEGGRRRSVAIQSHFESLKEVKKTKTVPLCEHIRRVDGYCCTGGLYKYYAKQRELSRIVRHGSMPIILRGSFRFHATFAVSA